MDYPVVPCNGCTRCCHGDAIRILPGEDASQWLTETHDRMPGHLMLAHKANGDCVYLVETGCSIHDTKPHMCKEMDCRIIAQRMTFTQVRRMDRHTHSGNGLMMVWRRGRELLKETDDGN